MASNGTILLEGVSKSFFRGSTAGAAYTTLKSFLFSKRSQRGDVKRFSALDNLSLEVKPGASLGVIGRNGSGKSSLLKLIAGIYKPDAGKIKISGRVSALIELGAGFHPEFTGRENVFLGGAMFGLTKREVQNVFDDIVNFAELEDFIDEPVRTYSSGMFMRLGFSLAVHTEPDVLLVDEVLSVGDAPFVAKCREKILELRQSGVTLLLVSHDLHSIQTWCDEVLWLHKAKKKLQGNPQYVIDSYLGEVSSSSDAHLEEERVKAEEVAEEEENPADSTTPSRWGSKDIEILDVKLFSGSGESTWCLSSEENFRAEIKFRNNQGKVSACFGIGIYRLDGVHILGTNTMIDNFEIDTSEINEGVCSFELPRLSLAESTYYLDIAIHDSAGVPFDYHHLLYKFSVQSKRSHLGVISPELNWKVDVS